MLSFSFYFFARPSSYRSRRLIQTLPHPDKSTVAHSALDNDRTYEDAVLDLQIRTFMHAEYGAAEPPPGIFARLVRAIEQGLAASGPRAGARQSFPAHIMAALTGPATGRLLPSFAALALVLMVFGSNSARFLGYNSTSPALGSFQPAPTQLPEAANPLAVAPTVEIGPIEGLQLPIKDDAAFYDRAERLLPTDRHEAKGDQPDNPSQYLQFDSRFGVQ